MEKYYTDQLFTYPVKSVGPVSLSKIQLTETGFNYDRQWMLVYPDGNMISQREFPELNKIECIDLGDSFKLSLHDNPTYNISFNKLSELLEPIEVSLWGSNFKAYTTQTNLAHWFSEYLGRKVYIVTDPNRFKLLQNFTNYSMLNFQDSSPVHLVNHSSVNYLATACGVAIDPMQFRANIYIDLGSPFAEDYIENIIINDIEFKLIKSCERCIMINLKPYESKFNKEPLRSLSRFRKSDHKVKFGIYLKANNSNTP